MPSFVVKSKGNRLFLNDREVTNPVAKFAIIVASIIMGGIIAAGVIFIVLPIVGIVLTVTVALLSVMLVAMGIGILVLIWLFVF